MKSVTQNVRVLLKDC